jgi:drug/metabolite transporter (DMT)-like permease
MAHRTGATLAIAPSRANSGADVQQRGAGAAPPRTRAFLLLLVGGTCIGFGPALIRLSDVGPVASASWRMCIGAPLLWSLVWARELWRRRGVARTTATAPATAPAAAIGSGVWPLVIWLCGCYFAVDIGVWHISVTLTTVANATLLANCAPLLVTLYTLVVLRQRPSGLFLAALALAMAGAVTLVSPKLHASGTQLRGDLTALLAACFYTAYMVVISKARDRYDTLRLMAMTTTVTGALLLPVALLLVSTHGQPFWPSSADGWTVVVALAILTQCLGQGCIAYALAHLPVTLSTIVLLIQPVVAAASAWWLFGEQLRAWQLLGAIVLMIGIALARRSSQ